VKEMGFELGVKVAKCCNEVEQRRLCRYEGWVGCLWGLCGDRSLYWMQSVILSNRKSSESVGDWLFET